MFFFVFRMGRVITRKKETRHLKEYVVVCHRHRKNKNLIKIHLKGRTTTVSFSFFLSLGRQATPTQSIVGQTTTTTTTRRRSSMYQLLLLLQQQQITQHTHSQPGKDFLLNVWRLPRAAAVFQPLQTFGIV